MKELEWAEGNSKSINAQVYGLAKQVSQLRLAIYALIAAKIGESEARSLAVRIKDIVGD